MRILFAALTKSPFFPLHINHVLMCDFKNNCCHWYNNINLEVLFSLLVFLHSKFYIFISEHYVPTRDFFKVSSAFFQKL